VWKASGSVQKQLFFGLLAFLATLINPVLRQPSEVLGSLLVSAIAASSYY